jgi:hypothetical protein
MDTIVIQAAEAVLLGNPSFEKLPGIHCFFVRKDTGPNLPSTRTCCNGIGIIETGAVDGSRIQECSNSRTEYECTNQEDPNNKA